MDDCELDGVGMDGRASAKCFDGLLTRAGELRSGVGVSLFGDRGGTGDEVLDELPPLSAVLGGSRGGIRSTESNDESIEESIESKCVRRLRDWTADIGAGDPARYRSSSMEPPSSLPSRADRGFFFFFLTVVLRTG